MPHPSLALQKAVFAALSGDAAVVALVGDRIHDAPPRAAAFPYVVFGEARADDWSTGTEAGAEHRLTLHVWSRERGKKEAFTVMDAIAARLHDAPLTLAGHHLVNLQFEASSVAAEADGVTWRGTARFRAVTEAE